jgi:hypothetical protein
MSTPSDAFVPEYWLCHSEGFAVVAPPEGRLGYVDEVRFGLGIDRPDAIAFRRTGGHDLVVVPVSDVDRIVPECEEIWLRRRRGLPS